MTSLANPKPRSLLDILEARDHPMAACRSQGWLSGFIDIPDDAAMPLAMSGPHPRATGSYGAECIAWAEREMGITLRWWQALAVTRQLEHDDSGTLVWREVIETGPRRIGKSVRLRVVAMWRLANAHRIGEKQLAMLVSKDLAVGKEIHRGAWRWAESREWKVTRLNGGQEIEAPDESRWLLRADTAVYGYDVGYGQVDESWGVDPQSITDGLEPALLERLWSQLHLTSTAHVKATSLMRRRLLAALKNADQDILLLFWGARPDADFSSIETWRSASPHWSADRESLMARKYAAAQAGEGEPEFDDPDPVRGWAAQYLNVWPLLESTQVGGALPGWDACGVDVTPPPVAAIGVSVSIGGENGSIASADLWDDGRVNLSAVDRRPGTTWLPAEVKRIQEQHRCAVVLDERCPDASLRQALEDEGVDLTIATLADYVEACSELVRRVADRSATHQRTTELDTAVAGAEWRSVGDGRRVFGRVKSSVPIDMLEGATLAMWGCLRRPTYDVLDSIF